MTAATGMAINAESAAGLFPAVPPAVAIPAVDVNRVITTIIAAGNAAGLFPVIAPATQAVPKLNGTTSTSTPGASPTSTPSPVPATGPRAAERAAAAAADASPSPGLQVMTVGLIAVALAIMLAMTRLFARRRTGARGRRAQ